MGRGGPRNLSFLVLHIWSFSSFVALSHGNLRVPLLSQKIAGLINGQWWWISFNKAGYFLFPRHSMYDIFTWVNILYIECLGYWNSWDWDCKPLRLISFDLFKKTGDFCWILSSTWGSSTFRMTQGGKKYFCGFFPSHPMGKSTDTRGSL